MRLSFKIHDVKFIIKCFSYNTPVINSNVMHYRCVEHNFPLCSAGKYAILEAEEGKAIVAALPRDITQIPLNRGQPSLLTVVAAIFFPCKPDKSNMVSHEGSIPHIFLLDNVYINFKASFRPIYVTIHYYHSHQKHKTNTRNHLPCLQTRCMINNINLMRPHTDQCT